LFINLLAQSRDVTNEPGYVDFGSFTSLESSSKVTEVIIDEDLLSALAAISSDEDPNIMAILNGLKLVKANVFEASEENSSEIKSKINNVDSKLSGTDWKRIVKTKSSDEIANVYIKQNNNKQIVGLVVTSFESSGEAAFVNIVGTIDLATIGKLGNKFNIPHLEGIKKHNGDENED
jgi:hypothetical protein